MGKRSRKSKSEGSSGIASFMKRDFSAKKVLGDLK